MYVLSFSLACQVDKSIGNSKTATIKRFSVVTLFEPSHTLSPRPHIPLLPLYSLRQCSSPNTHLCIPTYKHKCIKKKGGERKQKEAEREEKVRVHFCRNCLGVVGWPTIPASFNWAQHSPFFLSKMSGVKWTLYRGNRWNSFLLMPDTLTVGTVNYYLLPSRG